MQLPRLRPTRTVIIAGAVTLLLGAGTAVAAAAVMGSNSPVSSSGVIDACWTNAEINGSHIVVLQDQGTTCPKGTTPISWNESGSAGAPGSPGPAGPSGPAGPAGPTGPAGPSGAAGSPGANGSPGAGAVVADSAPASACPNGGITVTDGSGNIGYVCNGADGSPGPSGPAGPSGPSGPAGPSGPSGAAGALSALDQLNGISCNSGAGTTQVSYGSGGSVTITCVTATTPAPTSSSPTPAPTNTSQATAEDLSYLCPSQTGTLTGTLSAGDSLWYFLPASELSCTLSGQMSITSTGVSGSIELFLYQLGSTTPEAGPGSFFDLSGGLEIQITGVTGGPLSFSIPLT